MHNKAEIVELENIRTNIEDIAIVALIPADLPQLLIIEEECNKPCWTAQMFNDELLSDSSLVLGMKDTLDNLVGYIVCQIVPAINEAHIYKFGIKKSFRQQGLGRRLLIEAIDAIQCKNISNIWLEVRLSNLAAQNLYHSLGFKTVALRKGYYVDNGEDAIVMHFSSLAMAVGGE